MEKTLKEVVLDVLSARAEQRLSVIQIATLILEVEPAWCDAKRTRGKAKTDMELKEQVRAEISRAYGRGGLSNPNLRILEDSPRKFYWTEKTEEQELQEPEVAVAPDHPTLSLVQANDIKKVTEADLYPKLGEFLARYLNVLAVRIDDRRSSNAMKAGSNQWLYPDLVGIEDLYNRWEDHVRQVAHATGQEKFHLWSFEVKLKINRANLRETYFQAVSNSSWAHFGYLVACEVSEDTLAELRMLHGMHGIGFIHLNMDEPSESRIIIPASKRGAIDWAGCSRIARENPDFREFLRQVKIFSQSGDPVEKIWAGAVPF